jgi:hypothetical protein
MDKSLFCGHFLKKNEILSIKIILARWMNENFHKQNEHFLLHNCWQMCGSTFLNISNYLCGYVCWLHVHLNECAFLDYP